MGVSKIAAKPDDLIACVQIKKTTLCLNLSNNFYRVLLMLCHCGFSRSACGGIYTSRAASAIAVHPGFAQNGMVGTVCVVPTVT